MFVQCSERNCLLCRTRPRCIDSRFLRHRNTGYFHMIVADQTIPQATVSTRHHRPCQRQITSGQTRLRCHRQYAGRCNAPLVGDSHLHSIRHRPRFEINSRCRLISASRLNQYVSNTDVTRIDVTSQRLITEDPNALWLHRERQFDRRVFDEVVSSATDPRIRVTDRFVVINFDLVTIVEIFLTEIEIDRRSIFLFIYAVFSRLKRRYSRSDFRNANDSRADLSDRCVLLCNSRHIFNANVIRIPMINAKRHSIE